MVRSLRNFAKATFLASLPGNALRSCRSSPGCASSTRRRARWWDSTPANGADLAEAVFTTSDLDLRTGRDLCAVLQCLPSGQHGYQKDAFLEIAVALLEFLVGGLDVVGAVRATVVGTI